MTTIEQVIVLLWFGAGVIGYLRLREQLDLLRIDLEHLEASQALCAARSGGKDESQDVQESNQGAGQG